jgi:hypothetical protein
MTPKSNERASTSPMSLCALSGPRPAIATRNPLEVHKFSTRYGKAPPGVANFCREIRYFEVLTTLRDMTASIRDISLVLA